MGKKSQGTVETVEHDHDHNDGDEGIFQRGGWWHERAEDRDWHEVNSDPQESNLDAYGTGEYTYRNKPILDLEGVTDQIWTGVTVHANNGVITYTFADTPQLVGLYNNPQYGFGAGDGYRPFSEAQMDAARSNIQLWDDVLAVEFRESQGTGADIVLANSLDPAQAYAYYPQYGFTNAKGYNFFSDAFFADPNVNWTNEWFTPGGYGNTTIIHEIGHSIGLSHPGRYNGAGATNYAGQAEYAQDSMQYSIMSYWSGGETGAVTINWTLLLNNYAQTPMLHDIYAAQQAYGADMTTRTDDTVYGFNSTAGHEVYDFNLNPFPYLSIWDAGGNDTIDLSGFTGSNYLNLNAGTFSSVGQEIPSFEEVNAARAAEGFGPYNQATYDYYVSLFTARTESRIEGDTGVSGVVASQYDNLSIAYGVTIENGIGGQARDVIVGNEVDNMIDGQAGDDVLFGNDGDDIIIGGLGADEMSGGEGADTFVFSDLEMGDLITDFAGSEGDMIDLSAFADDLGTDLSFIADAAFDGTAGQVRYEAGVLSMDANGDMAADFSVTLANNADVDASMMALAMSA